MNFLFLKKKSKKKMNKKNKRSMSPASFLILIKDEIKTENVSSFSFDDANFSKCFQLHFALGMEARQGSECLSLLR